MPEPAALSFHEAEVPVDPSTLTLLRQMGADGRISADHFLVRDSRARLVLNRHDIEVLRDMGLEVEIGRDLIEQARRVQGEVLERTRGLTEADELLTGFVDQYLDTAGILGRFQSLHDEFPALTQWTNLPHPTLGYDGSQAPLAGPAAVKLFRITTTPASVAKPGLLLLAGIHAREWIPPLVAIEFAEQLLRTYTPGSMNPEVQAVNQMVEGLDILIIPAANPDGINFSHHDFAMWRKNRRANPAPPAPCPGTFDANGVDNNRNYSTYWGDAGSSGDVCSESYRGPSALSERENRNVLHVVEQFPNLLVAVDCHSFGEDIFRAQPTGGAFIASQPVEPRDHAIFLTLEAAMNTAISSVSPGKTYTTGTTNNHAGTGDDYLFLAHRIFGFTVECAQQFQPPIASALVTVQEVAAAMRALARETLELAGQFTFPVNIIHVLDRSGSMVSSGYVEPARSNGKRMVDLMSLNDSVGIVSFNQASTTHMALTAIDNPGVYTTARTAVDGIAFGGFTSIGAGLQAAGGLLAGAGGPRAIVLLSDGYQNREPWVVDVLPELPAGTRVHTIALGPQSDQALLETVADATGGQYYFSPDELDLHEIYNYIRAEATEEELALNETLVLSGTEAAESAVTRTVVVDEGAAHAAFTVSWNDPATDLQVTLHPPQGPVMDLSRVRRTDGKAYKVLRLRRPQAGVWSLTLQRRSGVGRVSCTAAAFLRSDLRLRLLPAARAFLIGRPLGVFVQVQDQGRTVRQIQGRVLVKRPAASLGTLLQGFTGRLPRIPSSQLAAADALPRQVLQALLLRDRLRRQTGQDPLRHLEAAGELRPLSGTEPGNRGHTAVVTSPATSIPGTYNVKVQVEGRSEVSGRPFVRVGLRSIRVG